MSPEDVDPFDGEGREFRSISTALGLERLGLSVIEAAPGEQLPLQYHYHDEQEEAFFVVDGTLHVETPERKFVVQEGDLFVVEPSNPQRAFNPADADESVEVLAVGAPSVDDVNRYEPDDN